MARGMINVCPTVLRKHDSWRWWHHHLIEI